MRDPKRIEEVLSALAIFWRNHPDWRLGQLLSNLDINRITEDDVLLQRLQDYNREWDARQETDG